MPPGSFSGYGYSSCISCPCEKVLMKNGMRAFCNRGQYSNTNEQKRNECSEDAYTSLRNVLPWCNNFGFTSSSPLVRIKKRCSYGSTLLSCGDCDECPAGTYFNTRKGRKCEKNDANTISFERIMDFCSDWPYACIAPPGSSSCSSCRHGQALNCPDWTCGTCYARKLYHWTYAECARCVPEIYKPDQTENIVIHILPDMIQAEIELHVKTTMK